MVLEKECRPKPEGESSTAAELKEEKDWHFKRYVDAGPFLYLLETAKSTSCHEKGSVLLNAFSFTKTERIRKSSEYRFLSKSGNRQYSDYFIIVSRKNQFLRSRLGITVSKKVGKAVTRNRIKRIIRDYFRVNRSMLSVHLDINVIVRRPSAEIGNQSLRQELGRQLKTVSQKHAYQHDD